ncbi:GNAT family N-acetyltransferase [Actinocatenispora sera]|uniref:GNAT family N-acetyltransferase n=1 Tax=Actinocatenispora sera TaxID=390989 RepID=UPI0033EFA593
MAIELRPLRHEDAAAQCAGEDEQTVRWLTGGYGTLAGTRAHFDRLAANAEAGRGKRGFGVWWDDRLAGYVDCDPDNRDGLQPGEAPVNLSYCVHPWARGHGVAVAAVGLICSYITDNAIGETAAIRVEPANTASVRVAERCGFRHCRRYPARDPAGNPISYDLYLHDL